MIRARETTTREPAAGLAAAGPSRAARRTSTTTFRFEDWTAMDHPELVAVVIVVAIANLWFAFGFARGPRK